MGPHPLFHPSVAGFPLWAVVVTAVAVGEEALLRGALFNAVEEVHGIPTALIVTTIAFAILHVPLYGIGALPLDLAVGLWLGGLRVVSGGVTAPATAHVLADLAGWWLW
jgi:membrane protease YdiL (CAAX protease family)